MSSTSDARQDRTTDAPLVMKWSLFLATACIVAYTCLLIMRPFFGVLRETQPSPALRAEAADEKVV
jgi:hypothetical protein